MGAQCTVPITQFPVPSALLVDFIVILFMVQSFNSGHPVSNLGNEGAKEIVNKEILIKKHKTDLFPTFFLPANYREMKKTHHEYESAEK